MKKTVLIIAFPFLFILFFSNCSNRELKKSLHDFCSLEVNTSVKLEKITGREIVQCVPDSVLSRLVIYYDSTTCSGCQIKHLYDKIDLFRLSDSLDVFDAMTIFSPRDEEYDNVVKELMLLNFPLPIYVDSYGEFRRKNSGIPLDNRFHTFLLNSNGNPVFVGSPFASSDLMILFEKALENIVEIK